MFSADEHWLSRRPVGGSNGKITLSSIRLINKFFNLCTNYRYRYSVAGVFLPFIFAASSAFMLWLSLYIILARDRSSLDALATALFATAVLVISLLRLCKPGRISKQKLKARREAIEKLKDPKYEDGSGGVYQKMLPSDTVSELYHRGIEAINVLSRDGWKFGDFVYATGSLVFNNAISEMRYFSCIEIDLPRKLPAMLFLSKRSPHNFAFLFKKTQAEKARLEANMEKYFDMYFPIHYHIDSISIMSPEVIEMMLQLKDFDIEIRDNTLLLYGPLIEEQSILTVVDTAIKMANKLSDHAAFYIDERAEDSRSEVSIIGSRLRESGNGVLVYGLTSLILAGVAAWQLSLDKGLLHKVAMLYLLVVLLALGIVICVGTIVATREHGKKLDNLQKEYEKRRNVQKEN